MVFKRHDPQSSVTPELKPEQRWTSTANRPGPEGASIIGSDLAIEGPSITMRCKGSLRIVEAPSLAQNPLLNHLLAELPSEASSVSFLS